MQTTAKSNLIKQEEVEKQLGRPITRQQFLQAYKSAKRKLARIIEREGDLGGERLKPYYITQLIAEAVFESSFSEYTILHSDYLRAAKRYERKITIQQKKEMPAAEAARQI